MQDPDVVTFSRRDYFSLLWVVMAALLGCLLLGGIATVGVNDINRVVLTGTPTANVMNFIISNLNTAIVATVGKFSTLVPPPAFQSSPTLTSTPTITISVSATSIFLVHFTSTSRGNSFNTQIPAFTPTKAPTATSTKAPPPTLTDTPAPTNTLMPSDTPVPTDTAVPPTDTAPPPPDTDTPVPLDTPPSYP